MNDESLESKSLWYRYKTSVWSETTSEGATVHNIMRTLRSIRNVKHYAYVSCPITSGKRFYELKLQKPDAQVSNLHREVFGHNYNIGWILTEQVRSRRDFPVQFPADLVPTKQVWSQPHFQALWLSIIAEKCSELHMAPGWEYSNGCVEEFTHAMQLRLGLPRAENLAFYNTKEDETSERVRMRNILAYDSQGNLISTHEAKHAISSAAQWITEHGFNADKLLHCVDLLEWNDEMIQKGFYQ